MRILTPQRARLKENRIMDNILEARDLSFSFEGRNIFQGLNFHLRRGEIYVLWGASGSGKSILLKLLSGLLFPDQGSVKIYGLDLATAPRKAILEIRLKTGFAFQEAALISNMAIYDNIALPLRYHTAFNESEVQGRVTEKMALFQVDRKYDRSLPAHLSLGMRKRAALARALVLDPAILFLDEPTSGLGVEEENQIASGLKQYQEKTQASLLLGSSDGLFALRIADRIGLLENGQITAEGSPQEVEVHRKLLKGNEAAAPRTKRE